MSNTSLAKAPLIAAGAVVAVGAVLTALPYAVAGLPWASSAPYILMGTGVAAIVLLLLSVVMGRRANREVEPTGSFFGDIPSPAPPAGEQYDFSPAAPAAALMPAGLSPKEEKEWKKSERKRLAEEEKFRKAAEKEAKKASKKSGKRSTRSPGGEPGDFMDATTGTVSPDWLSEVQEASFSHLQGQETRSQAVHDLMVLPAAPAFAAPAEEAAEAVAEAPPAPQPAAPAFLEAAAALAGAPTPVISATDSPAFREDEMTPDWMTAAYRDEEFTVPFAALAAEADNAQDSTHSGAEAATEFPALDADAGLAVEPIEVAVEQIEEGVAFADPGAEAGIPEEAGAAQAPDDAEIFDLGDDLVAEDEADAESIDITTFTEQATEMVRRLADLVAAVDARADRAESDAAQARDDALRARQDLADAQREIEEIRAGELADAQAEVDRLGRILASAEADMDRVLDSQDSIASAAALTERTRIGVRLRRIRAALEKDPAGAESVISQIDELLSGTSQGEPAGGAEASDPSA